MAETTVGDNVYRTGRLNAMTQFHLVRRLLPLVSEIPQVQPGQQPDMGKVLGSIASALSIMKDSDCEYVLGECLKVCRRKQGEGWVPVWNTAGNKLQFDDIDLPTMITLAMTTLEENLGSFLPALPSRSLSANPEPNATSNS